MAMIPAVLRAQTTVEGVVVDSLRSRAPLPSATVVLVEHNRYATSDAQGRFRFEGVPMGRATIGILHPMLDSLDVQLPPVAVNVTTERAVQANVTIPPADRLYAHLCTEGRDSDGGVIVGRVRNIDDNSPIAGAAVATEWVEYTVVKGVSTPKAVATAARSDERGMFVLCNVPTDVPLSVRARHAGIVAGPALLTLDERLLGRTEIGVSLRDTAARQVRVVDSLLPRDEMRGTATLRGKILRTDSTPAAFAAIGVVGTGRVTRADSNGVFALDGIPAGTRTVDLRSIGSAPQLQSLDFTTGAVRDTTLMLAPPIQTLATVKTTRPRMANYEAAGFFDRRKIGLGAFITEEEIKRFGFFDLNGVFLNMRGIRIDGGMVNGMPKLRGVQGACIPAFFVDGVRFMVDGPRPMLGVLYPFTDLEVAVRPDQIKGIEVYAGPGAPPQFDVHSERCGSVVIWTH
ncbi:carboxypeptidase regulatory-like domain-containing protein [Gemmatimonas sp.]|uniref:carboxypeptidase regulatory-like domain-containing protein n=1 Tax=Gemmatimonas sp. TaxID=1962908 RepID=UPI002ED8A84C